MRLGFVGTGTITRAAVTGFAAAEIPIAEMWLSPRGRDTAEELARTHETAGIAASNQDVLNRCDVIILAVRPQIAREVLAELDFRPDHHVISLVAGFSLAMLEQLVAPARTVVRAVPLPAVARRIGPTAIYPPDETASALFGLTGTAVEVETEEQFNALLAVTAEMASFFALLGTCTEWLEKEAVPGEPARRYVGAMFNALSVTALQDPLSFDEQVREHMTRGGLNEQVYLQLGESGVFDRHRQALDDVLTRLNRPG